MNELVELWSMLSCASSLQAPMPSSALFNARSRQSSATKATSGASSVFLKLAAGLYF
jgi:hypothetical protein